MTTQMAHLYHSAWRRDITKSVQRCMVSGIALIIPWHRAITSGRDVLSVRLLRNVATKHGSNVTVVVFLGPSKSDNVECVYERAENKKSPCISVNHKHGSQKRVHPSRPQCYVSSMNVHAYNNTYHQ